MMPWVADWAWSLPLILLTVVIHVFGLGLINKGVGRVLSRSMDRRRLIPLFALVMGVAGPAGDRTARDRERGVGRRLPRPRRCARCQIGDALFIERNDHIRPREFVARAALAIDGRPGGAQRNVAVRADDRLPVRDDPGGPAAGSEGGPSRPLTIKAQRRRGPEALRAIGGFCRVSRKRVAVGHQSPDYPRDRFWRLS